ncbi:MAG: DUF885 domain-containing protein [Alphaproteobacteria bacterium]|nr:DUF885 domain-containing protein [Alphaproteobacteria bacterium]
MSRTPMFQLSSDLVDRVVAHMPVLGTFAGVGGVLDTWDDYGVEGTAALDAMWRDTLGELDSTEVRDAWDALARDVIRDFAEAEIRHVEAGDHLYDLNILASNFQTPTVVCEVVPFGTADEADALAQRLETVDVLLETYRERLAEGVRTGRVVARRQVIEAIAQGHAHASADSVFTRVARQAAAAHPDRAARLEAAAPRARAAYAGLCGWLEREYLPHAPEREAVGRERYARAAERHLGMAIDLEETVEWGWSEVRRIEARMRELADALVPGATVGEAVAALNRDPRWCMPDPDAFVAHMRALQLGAVEALHGTTFDVPDPVRAIDVVLAPPGGPVGAYYRPPSEDFSRSGAVCYRLERDADIPWIDEVSTAYHEGFPGHHLQIATATHLADQLSRFHRLFAHNTGFAEGWALYAEQLMLELGFYDHPALELGKLINELARAYRVVVDIGLHLELAIPTDFDFHPGETWTFDIAVEAMRDRSMLSPQKARDNVVRYLGWPGQAITYKVGERVILEAREALCGQGLPLADFHARVVGGGSMGLGRLRERLAV